MNKSFSDDQRKKLGEGHPPRVFSERKRFQMKTYNVLAPGPVNLHPRIQAALSLPMIHHRTPEFDQILAAALAGLKNIFSTQQHVFILSSTGSGGMEALLVNLLSPGDDVLCVVSGKFGERWRDMAKVFGAQVSEINVPWGQAIQPEKVEIFLAQHPNCKFVLCQACETSTGVLHPIQKLAAIIKKYPQTCFLVDGITAVGSLPLPMDDWGIDGLVGGSQKAFMLPTGLSFVAFSQKAWLMSDQAKTPRFYFDLRKEKAANEKGETFFSSSVTLVRALQVSLEILFEKGLVQHYAEVQAWARWTRKWCDHLGLASFTDRPSPSLSTLVLPETVNGVAFRHDLEEKFGITVMGGQDQLKGRVLRIGHMGFLTNEGMIHLILSLHQLLLQQNQAQALALDPILLKTQLAESLRA